MWRETELEQHPSAGHSTRQQEAALQDENTLVQVAAV